MTAKKSAWKPGDVVLFSGGGLFSRAVKFWTCSPYSHVAVIARVTRAALWLAQRLDEIGLDEDFINSWQTRDLLFESTFGEGLPCELLKKTYDGAQSHDYAKRVDSYAGSVWRLPVAKELDTIEQSRLAHSLLEKLGVPYDERRVYLAGSRLTRCLWGPCAADRKKVFCVEYVADALKHAFLTRKFLAGEEPGLKTPQKFVDLLIASKMYEQPEKIK